MLRVRIKVLGLEVARELGRAGFTVLLGAREASRGEESAAQLRGKGLVCVRTG